LSAAELLEHLNLNCLLGRKLKDEKLRLTDLMKNIPRHRTACNPTHARHQSLKLRSEIVELKGPPKWNRADNCRSCSWLSGAGFYFCSKIYATHDRLSRLCGSYIIASASFYVCTWLLMP
jgi:hypothetical protein